MYCASDQTRGFTKVSLKKKKIKKRKKNNTVDVLKKSLSQADELNRNLLKEIEIFGRIKNQMMERVSYLMDQDKLLNIAVRESNQRADDLSRELQNLKGRMIITGKTKDGKAIFELADEKKLKGRSGSILIADELCDDRVGIGIKKSYEPSELVDTGDLIEIDRNGKIVERFDGNKIKFPSEENPLTPSKESSVDLGTDFKKTRETVTEQIREAFKSGKVVWGNRQFDVEDIKIDLGGSKKVSKEKDPYDLLNTDYLEDCVDVPDGENYKDGYMDKFGNFIKNTNIKT